MLVSKLFAVVHLISVFIKKSFTLPLDYYFKFARWHGISPTNVILEFCVNSGLKYQLKNSRIKISRIFCSKYILKISRWCFFKAPILTGMLFGVGFWILWTMKFKLCNNIKWLIFRWKQFRPTKKKKIKNTYKY